MLQVRFFTFIRIFSTKICLSSIIITFIFDYYHFLFLLKFSECGLTKYMKHDFNISLTPHAQMHCQMNPPHTRGNECHCYGKVCLVSEVGKGNCSAGNVFVNGRAFCGSPNDDALLEFGKTVCRELGFRNAIRVTTSNTVGE